MLKSVRRAETAVMQAMFPSNPPLLSSLLLLTLTLDIINSLLGGQRTQES